MYVPEITDILKESIELKRNQVFEFQFNWDAIGKKVVLMEIDFEVKAHCTTGGTIIYTSELKSTRVEVDATNNQSYIAPRSGFFMGSSLYDQKDKEIDGNLKAWKLTETGFNLINTYGTYLIRRWRCVCDPKTMIMYQLFVSGYKSEKKK